MSKKEVYSASRRTSFKILIKNYWLNKFVIRINLLLQIIHKVRPLYTTRNLMITWFIGVVSDYLWRKIINEKSWFFIGLIVLFGFIVALNSSIFADNPTGDTIVDAIEKTERNVTKIVYLEEVKGGVVVFYKKSIGKGGESVASGYVKKTLWGWQWSFGGEHSDGVSKGFSAQYFPYTKGTPFPLLFGEIKKMLRGLGYGSFLSVIYNTNIGHYDIYTIFSNSNSPGHLVYE